MRTELFGGMGVPNRGDYCISKIKQTVHTTCCVQRRLGYWQNFLIVSVRQVVYAELPFFYPSAGSLK